MIMYHGTSTEHLNAILRDGILPRHVSGRASNFGGQVESKPDLVYLSDAYPVYFAAGATEEPFLPVVLQVDVCEENLFPDEDFLAYVISEKAGLDLFDVTEEINPYFFQEYWQSSLEFNGNVATPRVSPEQILDHRILPENDIELLLALGIDSMPTVLNYSVMGKRYRNAIKNYFLDGRDAALRASEAVVLK